MDELIDYLPLIVPLLLIQLIMMTFALFDIRKRTHLRGPKWLWILIVIFLNLLGPVIYFLAAREDE